jgi:hypothetical protein
MSLLLKALSRVDRQEPVPVVEAQNTPVEPSIPNVAPLISSDVLPGPAALGNAVEQTTTTAPTFQQPAVDQTPIDQTPVEQPALAQTAQDQPPAEIEAAQTSRMVLPSIETTLPPIETAPPANNPVFSPSDAVSASESYDELTSEPIWQQLAELQDLVSTDLDRFNVDHLDSTNSIEVTKTEELEIDAIDDNAPNIAPLPEAYAPEIVSPPLPSVAPFVPPAQTFTPLSHLSPTTPFAAEPSASAPVAPIAAISPPPSAPLSPITPVSPLNFKPEFRELRDQLLSRINIAKHPTLLLVDAGQNVGDSSWLLPLAASIVEKLNAANRDKPPQILIVEAAGSDCGIAQSLGLDAHLGLNHVLARRADWQTTIQSTPHPQIKLLGCGAGQLRSSDFNRLAKCWAELSLRFDLILVAAGPVFEPHTADQIQNSSISSATIFFPLAAAAILCIELNGTSQAAALEAKRLLDARGIQMLGCIVQPT